MPQPVVGVMTGNVWLREEPSDESERLGITLERGQPVEILSAFEDWIQVRWTPRSESEVIGWTPANWVGTFTEVPARLVTPSSSP